MAIITPGLVQTRIPLCKLLWMQFQSSMRCCRPPRLERTIRTMVNGTVSRPRELEFSLTSLAISDSRSGGWRELNLLGGVIGIDLRRPAIKLPAVGRLGVQLSP